MTRREIDQLRSRYRAACQAYSVHAAQIADHSKGGERPPPFELEAEEHALWELARIRRQLLDALGGAGNPGNDLTPPVG